MLKPRLRIRTALSFVAAVLAACGGGGASADGPLPSFDTSAVAKNDPGSALPAQWQHGVFMEIYVRGYKDSDGDGIGDLKGVTHSLDYLKSLGISGIWLMPITKSQDHDHGYAVTDYRDIETQYGSLADLDELVAQAHARGIGVIIDYVMNHSAAQHPAFINSNAGAGNAYRDWYIWRSPEPTGWSIYNNDPWHQGNYGFYFAGFWDQMPDFNLLNPAVISYHNDSMRFWLNRGVDGFRFDAVANLVENGPNAWEAQPQDYTLMSDVRSMLNGYAQRFMVCEGPPDPIGFSNACGSAFAFSHNNDIVNAAKGNPTDIRNVVNYFNPSATNAPLNISTMVSNHDSFAGQRLYDQVGGNLAQYKLAAATYLLQPGTPFIYYGEEVGMAGAASLSGDWKLRTPMSWSNNTSNAGFTSGTPFRALSANVANYNVASESADANSLLAFYKSVIALRNTRTSLSQGSYEIPAASGTVMSFQRSVPGERSLVVFNYGTSAATASLANLPTSAVLTPVLPAGGADVSATSSGTASLSIPAQSFAVYDVH